MPAEPTPADVDLAKIALSKCATSRGYRLREERQPLAEAVVAALAEAGRLRDPGGEPDLWQYAAREPTGLRIFHGVPRWISPLWLRRPLYAGGPWQPVNTPEEPA